MTTPAPTPCDIVDTAAIADRAGVTVHAVRRWRERDLAFPEPTWALAVGPVWVWDDVAAWLTDTGRIPSAQ